MNYKCDANCSSGAFASVFFSYIEDGNVRKVNLCESCASERGINDPTGYSMVDVLQGMGEETNSKSRPAKEDELTCEACGFAHTDFKKTGRFGCAHCYQVFNEGLEGLLEAMHKKTEHAGKVPSFVAEEIEEEVNFESKETSVSEWLDFDDENIDELVEEAPEPQNLGVQVTMLQDQLDIAISDEDYEEAAKIRDQITNLQKELGGD